MANQGAKKRRDQNRKHMQNLLRLIIFCNVVYIVLRLLVFRSSVTWKHWVGLLFTSMAYAIPYQQLANMASSAYDDSGDLIDGGHDLSSGGVSGYLHDVIYITSFVQVMSIVSGKFWYTYLLIPAFAVYQLSGFLKGWLFQGSEGPVEDEKSRRKREKMEKKAQRPKFIRTRGK